MNITIKKITLSVLFSVSLLLSACSHSQQQSKADFDDFLDELFLQEVQGDSITLNYTLSKPEEYGIKAPAPTLGEYSLTKMKENLALTENYRERLKDFSYKSLTQKQKETYDVLMAYFDRNLLPEDLLLYTEVLGPNTGIQAQLPVLLSEFNFNDKEDIETYLSILSCVKDYFAQILAFERQKAENGLFMSDDTADQIINQCELFLEAGKNNAIIEVFNDRIDETSFLSAKEKKQYRKENKEKVLNEVIPAYQLLIDGLAKLKGSGKNEQGLSYFPKGKEYYAYLIQNYVGSAKSIAKIRRELKNTIDECVLKIQKAAAENPDLVSEAAQIDFPSQDPEEILNFLKEDTKDAYPVLSEVNYSVKYVHESLEEYLSPAFYLSPEIDNYTQNCIYINRCDSYDLSDIFTTLAHEGYPGHLYQTVYYNETSPYPIRTLLNFSGYSEGWATYAELDSYQRAGFSPEIAEVLKANQTATLCMYAYIDLGVNYYGWTYEDTKEYLANFGIENEDSISNVYSAMINEPGNYLKYTGGYLEFVNLQEKAEKTLKDNFDLKEFRKFVLDFGPAPFDVIDKYMEKWMKEQD